MEENKENVVIHFAHSQGAIITCAALQKIRRDYFLDKEKRNWPETRMRTVIFGSGYGFTWDHHILPEEYHFVYTSGDFVDGSVGHRAFNPFRILLKKNQSEIVHYWGKGVYDDFIDSDAIKRLSDGTQSHSFQAGTNVANTYNWWIHEVGGKVFQRDENIHGEKWWLKMHDYKWWDKDVTVEQAFMFPDRDYTVHVNYTRSFGLMQTDVEFNAKD